MGGLPVAFGGLVPPVAMPMTEDFDVDTTSLLQLIDYLIEAGVYGLFVLGSTSESVFLTDAQRAMVIAVAVRAAKGRVPVVVGIIDMTTARCLQQTRVARSPVTVRGSARVARLAMSLREAPRSQRSGTCNRSGFPCGFDSRRRHHLREGACGASRFEPSTERWPSSCVLDRESSHGPIVP
ncbi:MAG: dihydrodipicolinate synthase family protein [Chloroflexi bacterium]|nr:dihydrodipicolinate synthase family protein [Chloroflexota bacterium]